MKLKRPVGGWRGIGMGFILCGATNERTVSLSRSRMLDGWQCGWSGSAMGRCIYSVLLSVSLVPWFRRFDSSRCVVTSINRMMSNHSCLKFTCCLIEWKANTSSIHLICVLLAFFRISHDLVTVVGSASHFYLP
jgi:hypothetical protein